VYGKLLKPRQSFLITLYYILENDVSSSLSSSGNRSFDDGPVISGTSKKPIAFDFRVGASREMPNKGWIEVT
jgi:hypothetical protein